MNASLALNAIARSPNVDERVEVPPAWLLELPYDTIDVLRGCGNALFGALAAVYDKVVWNLLARETRERDSADATFEVVAAFARCRAD